MNVKQQGFDQRLLLTLLGLLVASAWLSGGTVWAQAQGKAEKSFSAVVTDAQGIESEVKNIIFYWEEKVSETAFVPHELREVPVKKGAATIKVKFESIKQIDVKPSPDGGPPTVSISLTNGKTGEFVLAMNGSFKGSSDFGDVEFPANGLKKIVFK
ncbi:MAG TPA: hypothetical protein VNK46_03615 [Nitrospiraceae bacterium]|jgi:hypothetical protein|nr:hypothetical protein [Nitrospiraceae bacterium]